MMSNRTFYVETSVWGMVAADQPAEMRRLTKQFLRSAQTFYISEVVLGEIARAPERSRVQIANELKVCKPMLLDVTDECRDLAEAYVAAGVVPKKKRDDALHVATATFHEIDIVVSWNHKHIANIRKSEQYHAVNLLEGFADTPLILTPSMVLYE
jgi:predicted nucleic acid-binding protein